MKSTLTLSALFCAASAVVAFPTPSEPLFVSRMVKREVAHDASFPVASAATSTCGDYALQEPQRLQVRSYNDSTVCYLSVTPDASTSTQLLTALPSSSGEQGAYEFDFQTCNYQGFTQGFSRNSGGSLGAPLEFWGRVVTNVTTTDDVTQTKCLAATPAQEDEKTGTFNLEECNDTDTAQWFRLQEGTGGATVSYFPVKNETGYVYDGQTPTYFKVDLHPAEGNSVNSVRYSTDNSQQYVRFD
ncbi:uncharacterized protein MEPE_05277 [Melanopsichium pennsylvanicum]|uniref:AA1-like domain-containing protein n=2 Tax=Melanopsichium pennsylvanicum TaxID=63383 RepID=A0AAJ4XQQ2_9BASI|nr:putative protein [Melanopsichium pennsylvanicum 4]SNX86568.1 uncharacterized protein MEPE_05277 [Melanopsichium pennsylvanicum]